VNVLIGANGLTPDQEQAYYIPIARSASMLQQIQGHSVRIVIGVAFFLLGFFITANTLALSDREIAVGLLAGLIGGLTMLVAVMWQERSAAAAPAYVRCS
jgi:hypothetical protein